MHSSIKTLLFCLLITGSALAGPGQEYYSIRIYSVTDSKQSELVENFLKQTYLPALHRAGVDKVGVFKPVETDTLAYGKKIYVLTPYPSWSAYEKIEAKLSADKAYASAADAYWKAPYDNAPYARMETILTKAFPLAPHWQMAALKGPVAERVYELRSYESATENIFANKVRMFNEGDEIGLFKRLGFNAVFYSSVVSGARMPNLMYMTSFDNRAARDAHWKTFVDDPQWKQLVAMPEYQHNVSKIDIYLLHPTEYSEM